MSLCGDFLDCDDRLRFELFFLNDGDSRVWFSSATIKFDSSRVILWRLELSFFLSSSLRELFFLRELFLSFLYDSESPRPDEVPLAPAWSEKCTDLEGLLLYLLVLARRCLVGDPEETEACF